MDEHREHKIQSEEDEATIDLSVLLRDFIRGVGKFWWLIMVLALIGAVIAYTRAAGTYYPMYRSEATFTVTTNTSDSTETSSSDYNFYYDSATADQLALTFPYILSSDLLTDAMEEDLGVESINGSVSATVIPNSNMITMYAISSDPETAKAILESAIGANLDQIQIDSTVNPNQPGRYRVTYQLYSSDHTAKTTAVLQVTVQ